MVIIQPSLRDFSNAGFYPQLKLRAILRGSVGTGSGSAIIFALDESVFMAASTVTPPTPATSAIFASLPRAWRFPAA